MKIKPLPGKVIVHNFQKGERQLKSGIILRNDDGKEHGVKSRWAQVYAVGAGCEEVKVGEWVLIEHGRWGRGIEINEDLTVYLADYASFKAASDVEPTDDYVGNSTESGFRKDLY